MEGDRRRDRAALFRAGCLPTLMEQVMRTGRGPAWGLKYLVSGAAMLLGPIAKAETITVGLVGAASSTHWPIYIGLTKGYFAAEDLQLDTIFVQSSAAMVQQLTA